jgi:Fe2+ transport system protein FeoA
MIFKPSRHRRRHGRHGQRQHGRDCLRDCRAGELVVIARIAPDLACGPRLRELGIIEGAAVLVLRQSDPLLLLAQDSRIAIDQLTAEGIQVNPADRE